VYPRVRSFTISEQDLGNSLLVYKLHITISAATVSQIMTDYNVLIIGGGPGGYVCALRAAQLGLSTALVESKRLGGVCLNWGCVPTKALYSASKTMVKAMHAECMGIKFSEPTIDLDQFREWKGSVVSTLVGGIETLLQKNGVTIYAAEGTLQEDRSVTLSTGETVRAEHVVLAMGSSPVEIPSFPFDNPHVWDSSAALELEEIPDRLLVIGGGVIGLELATIYNRLGSEVTITELLPEVLSTVDIDRRTVSTLKRAMKAQGISVITGKAAQSMEARDDTLLVQLSDDTELVVDRVLVAVGRRPNSKSMPLENLGITLDARGFVQVDENWQTSLKGIYAIGDLVPGPMLAHKASAEGALLAETLAGHARSLEFETIPQAVFTDPEIASVGISERLAKERGLDILIGRFPFAALGKALGMGEADGFFQVVANRSDHRLLGVQIIGAEASDLISEAAIALQSGLTLEAIADAVHPHPTLPEGLKEAAENALGRAIHTINRPQ